MNFIAYVIAWLIIAICVFVFSFVAGKVAKLIMCYTPLGAYSRKKEEEHYRKLAFYIADEFVQQHFMVKEFQKFYPELKDEENTVDECEVKEG